MQIAPEPSRCASLFIKEKLVYNIYSDVDLPVVLHLLIYITELCMCLIPSDYAQLMFSTIPKPVYFIILPRMHLLNSLVSNILFILVILVLL